MRSSSARRTTFTAGFRSASPRRRWARTIRVPTLEGEETLSIPPGTQSGKVFRLRGKGIPGVNGRGRGDEFVSVNVVTPRKLNRDQRRLLEQLAELTPVENKPLERGLFDRVKDILG